MVTVEITTCRIAKKMSGNYFNVMLTTNVCIILCFSACYLKTKKLNYKYVYVCMLFCMGVKLALHC
jgi:hypothetical protein